MTTDSSILRLPRKLVVLCDGTWQNSSDQWEKDGFFGKGRLKVPTNITRIARALKPENSKGHPQVVYYQAGVGSSSWSTYDQLLGGGLAYGLSENVREAYSFIVDNYLYDRKTNVGDELYFLGFSRGAFTARSIAGVVSTIGILEKEAMDFFYYIFEDFENAGLKEYKPKLPGAYKDGKTFVFNHDPMDIAGYLAAYRDELVRNKMTRIVDIDAIAVFDTVGTLGLPIQPWLQKLGAPTTLHKYRFYDTGVSKRVKHAFQALALDEDRSAFQAAVWEREVDNNVTDLRQVWFPGAHSNIGGGYDDQSVADLTYLWMVSQLEPMLEFSDHYIDGQLKETLTANATAAAADAKKTGKPAAAPAAWGLGTVYEALTFPTSLGGSSLRTPDRYHRLVYQTGRPTSHLLNDTNEMFHASVRARAKFGGFTQDGKTPYSKALALQGWDCTPDKTAEGGETWTWKYNGDDKQCAGKSDMKEAPLSKRELAVLDAYTGGMAAKLFPPASEE